MSVTRRLAGLAMLLAFTGFAQAQSADLTEGPLADNFFRTEVAMKLRGKTRVQQEGKYVEQPLALDARHQYVEKILHAADGIADKTVRDYKVAEAAIRFGDSESRKTFRPGLHLMVTQRIRGQNITYCPSGLLTREEVELTEHFNTLALTGLLAGKSVKVGETWAVSKTVMESLCSLEALVGHDVACTLEEVRGEVAQVKVAGTVNGIDLGVNVKLLIRADYQFDLKSKRLTSLNWKQTDEREAGPASPALAAEAEVTVRRVAIEPPTELNAVFLIGVLPPGKEPPPELTQISYTDARKQFEVKYSREWIMTAQRPEHSVWRLMNRGDLVAQVTVVPWKKFAPGEMIGYEQFVDTVGKTPLWQETRRISKEGNDMVDVPAGNKAYRYCAAGKLADNEVVQYFYLLVSPRGDHVFVTFTMHPDRVAELDSRDVNFVRGITFPAK